MSENMQNALTKLKQEIDLLTPFFPKKKRNFISIKIQGFPKFGREFIFLQTLKILLCQNFW